MKESLILIFSLIFGLSTFSQKDSIRGNKFQLTGKIKTKVQMTPHCGTIAWGTVVEFTIIELNGMTYKNKSIGIIITCPEFYKEGFFEKGQAYQVVFSDKNQADFGWAILNRDLLIKNSLPFAPYAVSVKKIRDAANIRSAKADKRQSIQNK